jgi:hypothetical protein
MGLASLCADLGDLRCSAALPGVAQALLQETVARVGSVEPPWTDRNELRSPDRFEQCHANRVTMSVSKAIPLAFSPGRAL